MRYIIAGSITVICLILLCCSNSSNGSIKIFKNQNGQLIETTQFSPLDQIVVHFTPPGHDPPFGNSDLQYVLQSDNEPNFINGTIGDTQYVNGDFSLYAGGVLGRKKLLLKFKSEHGYDGVISTYITLTTETKIVTGNSTWDSFYPLMKQLILKNRRTLKVEDKDVTGYRSPDTPPIFLRDYTYQMKGFKYFENEMKSTMDCFFSQQQSNGEYKELVWENPQTHKIETLRNDVEADPEYLAVQAAYQIWQATGDDKWIQDKLPQLEKGLNYSMTDPFRWSKEYQLVKRPFTIDTWDFQYRSRFWPFDKSQVKMGIFHGDNSGMYDACRKLALLYNNFGNPDKAKEWNTKADHFKSQMNKVCWNGKYYTHQIHIDPVKVIGVDEKQILSLSNPYDINRGVTSQSQAVSIINEYQNRKKSLTPAPFAEWFSIQPYFPTGGFETTQDSWALKGGQYVNGGIMPLVGGELADAGFEHGFENYGASILNQYYSLVTTTGQANLWYYWNGQPGISDPATFSSDGWGAAAMLNAFMEGLAGIHDNSKLFTDVNCSPRWTYSSFTSATVIAKYGASDGYFAYHYQSNIGTDDISNITFDFTGIGSNIHFNILLPNRVSNVLLKGVYVDSKPVPYKVNKIEKSEYVVFDSDFKHKQAKIIFENPGHVSY